ncbi:tape measure protein [Latilactobacillus sakei]|uniref:tape measure protein n=1 Tax=Latilactobacillus sakei TaxID=1599 RepID=UPI00068F7BD8
MADGTVKITIEADGNKAIKSAKDLDNVFGQLGKGGKTNGLTGDLDGVAKHSGTAKVGVMELATSIGLVKVASAAFSFVTSGLGEIVKGLNESSATWQTFEGNMKGFGKSSAEIAKVKKELQSYAQATIYSASDMASTYAQLSAVGTKNTTKLVEGFGGLAAAAEDPQQAMKSLSQQATQMAAKPKVAWEDFKIMLEQTPAGMAAVAKEMGMSLTDLVKKIQDGSVKTDDFFNAIAKAGTNDTFGKMATQYKTVGEAMDGLVETLTNKLQPAFDFASKVVIGWVSSFTDAIDSINFGAIGKGFSTVFTPMLAVLKVIAPALKVAAAGLASFIAVAGTMAGIAKVISGVAQAFNILKLALLANPFALFVAGLVMVGVALVQVYKKSETFRNFVDKLVGTVKSALPSFDSFKKAFSGIGQVLGGGLTSIIAKVSDVIKGFADNFKQFKVPTEIFNLKLLIPILGALFSPIGMVVGAFKLLSLVLGNGMIQNGITSMIAGFATFSSTIAASAPQIGQSVGTLLGGILTAIATALPQIISGGLMVVAGLISGIAQGIPSLTGAAIQLIGAFTLAIVTLIPTVTASALSIVTAFTGAMVAALPILIASGASILIAFIQGLTSQLPGIVVAVGQVIVTFLTALTGQLPGILNAGINLLLTFINGITSRIPNIVPTVINMIVTFLNSVTANLPRILNAGINLLVAFLNGIARKVPSMIGAAVSIIVAFINGIAQNLGRVVNAAMNLVDAMVRGILQAQNRLLTAATTLINGFADNIRSHKDAIRGAALNLLDAMIRVFVPDALVDAGEAIIGGFLGGLKRGFEKVKGFVGGIATWIKDHKGPIRYDKKLLIPAGNAIMNSLNSGLVDKFGKVKQSIATLTSSIANSAVITMPAIEDSAFNKSLKRINNTLNNNQLSAGLSFAGITAESASGIGRGVAPTNSVVNNYSNTATTTVQTAKESNDKVLEALNKIANNRPVAVVDGSSFAPAYEPYGSTETARRSQMKGRGLAVDSKF